jgi:CDP-diacylglycerol--glycerol-3-phosphate 3-phosphatidyltransferase
MGGESLTAVLSGTVLVPLAIAAALLVSMAVFALLGGHRDRDASAKGTQLALGAGNFVIHWFMWLLGPVDWLLARARASPDALNLAGLVFGVLSGWAIGAGWLAAGGWAIALGGVCDILDGRVARARGLVSAYGAFIDSTLDRFVEVFAFLGFIVYLAPVGLGALWTAAAMAGSLLVSYTRARGESTGVLCKGGLMQRAERLILLCLACLVEEPLVAHFGWSPGSITVWVMVLIAVGTFGTAVYRTLWIGRRLRAQSAGQAED